MDNKVIGNRKDDNKDSKNRQKAQAATQKGVVKPNPKASYLGTQNSMGAKPAGPDQAGDKGVKLDAKNAKKIKRSNQLYSDKAIAFAKRARGGE